MGMTFAYEYEHRKCMKNPLLTLKQIISLKLKVILKKNQQVDLWTFSLHNSHKFNYTANSEEWDFSTYIILLFRALKIDHKC